MAKSKSCTDWVGLLMAATGAILLGSVDGRLVLGVVLLIITFSRPEG